MNEINPQDITNLIANPVLWVCLAWAVRELIQVVRQKQAISASEIKELSYSISKLSVSIVRLEVKLEAMEKAIADIPKMRRDIDTAHGRLRELNPKDWARN